MAKVIYGNMPIAQMKLFLSLSSFKWKTPIVLDYEFGENALNDLIKAIDFGNKDLVFLTNVPCVVEKVYSEIGVQYEVADDIKDAFRKTMVVMLPTGDIHPMISFVGVNPKFVLDWANTRIGEGVI